MSYRIVTNGFALRFPKDKIDKYDDSFLYFEEGGDNNLIGHDGKFVRSWGCLTRGQTYELFGPICKCAGACEGGSLKLNGRWTKPEGYIKYCRNHIENAVTYEPGIRLPFSLTLQFAVSDKQLESEEKDYCLERDLKLMENLGKSSKLWDYYGEKLSVFNFSLDNWEEIKLWFKLYLKLPIFYHVRVN